MNCREFETVLLFMGGHTISKQLNFAYMRIKSGYMGVKDSYMGIESTYMGGNGGNIGVDDILPQ